LLFEAVEILEKEYEKFDLVLMDISMPKMNGVEACNIIKSKINLPIIALTANATEGDRQKYLSIGFDEYLAKPVKKEDLAIILNRFLSNKVKKTKNKEDSKTQKKLAFDIKELAKRMDLDEEFAMELIKEYIPFIKKELNNLKEAISKNEVEAIEEIAHKIKGTSLNLGFNEIAEIASEIENNAKEQNSDFNFFDSFDELYSLFDNIKNISNP